MINMSFRTTVLILAIVVFLANPNAAHAEEVTLARYHDCASDRNFLSDHLPIFTKINGKEMKDTYKAGEYLDGLDIKLVTTKDGSISSFKIGDRMPLTARQLRQGLEFGVGPVTAHTVQLTDFDPNKGGILEFGHLKQLQGTGDDGAGKRNLNEYYGRKFGDNWGTYRLRLMKHPETQQWFIAEMNGKPVNRVFGILKARAWGLIVTGIPSMTSLYHDPTCPAATTSMIRTSPSVIEIKSDQGKLQCAVNARPDEQGLETDDRIYIQVP